MLTPSCGRCRNVFLCLGSAPKAASYSWRNHTTNDNATEYLLALVNDLAGRKRMSEREFRKRQDKDPYQSHAIAARVPPPVRFLLHKFLSAAPIFEPKSEIRS
mmetsp:Transcript_6850/g.20437  ORF Transcript_6850/g.20437 Transcript_6850/m.20437 type:complete len:103 (+) Transcript_6850:187-495(+)